MKTFAALLLFSICLSNIVVGQSICDSDGGVFYRSGHGMNWERTSVSWNLQLATSHDKKNFPMSDFTHALIAPDKNGNAQKLISLELGDFAGAKSSGDGYVTLTWVAENETVYRVILNEDFKMDAFYMHTITGGDVQCQCKK